jgi:hypothetical protein
MLSDKIKEILLYASSKYYNNHYVLKNLYFNLYYSQEGEDIILRKIFEGKTNGFYIDIGASPDKIFKYLLPLSRGMEWYKYRSDYILVEELRTDIENIIKDSKIFAFLKEHNYSLLYRTYNTSFYKKND